jgi:Mg2+/Co2+ transporter CorC
MLERVPTVGSRAQWETFSFEVIDMDGRRVDKIMVARLPEPETEPPPKAPARGRRRKADKADKSDG